MNPKHNGTWRPRKLNDLGFVGRGKSRHRPRNAPELYGGPYPFFQTGDIKAADLYLRNYGQTYSEVGLAQSKLWQPGTLCITIAANIAETAILGIPGCFPDSVVGFIPNDDEADARFVKYYIDTIKLSMQNVSKGTTQDNLSLDKLLTFDFLVPDVTAQRKIAGILSAYDDLIENNTRRIAILEEMAQAIYREWFVHFRFPGHDKVKLVNSPLGEIPEGWKVATLEEACQAVIDGDWIETKDQGGEDYRLLQVSNIGTGCFVETGNYRYVTQETFDRLRCQEVKPGQILISRMPKPIGRAWLVTEMPWRMITAVDVAIATAHPEWSTAHFLASYLNSPEHIENAEKHATGTTRPRVSRSALSGLRFVLPPLPIQRTFTDAVADDYSFITCLRKKNDVLRSTRDLLLPKLINGQLDVEELDIETGEPLVEVVA